MNITQLRYFMETCDTMNFTRAAENLNVSQTAVTKQIHLLENELGAQLFDRTQKKIQLTAAGNFFRRETAETLSQFDQSAANMKAYLAGERGTFKVGFLQYFDPNMLVSCISLFQKQYPDITLELYSGSNTELYQQLSEGSLDSIFAITPQDSDRYRSILVERYPLVVLMNRHDPLAEKGPIPVERLDYILYDARDRHPESQRDLESALLKIACFRGYAIVYGHTRNESYAPYLSASVLLPESEQSISLVYNRRNHHAVIEHFVDSFMKS